MQIGPQQIDRMATDTSSSTTAMQLSRTAGYASPTPVAARHVDTATAYNLWAQTYDTDGNFLQAIDSEEMEVFVPVFLAQLRTPFPSSSDADAGETMPQQQPDSLKLVDLGCGTGRNTLLLHRALAALSISSASIVGLDVSQGMLDVARAAVSQLQTPVPTELFVYDMLQPEASPVPSQALNADGIISTLVIEHVPIPVFFASVVKMLRPGGVLLLTDMHSELGSRTQAGFIDPETGERVRGTSYAHSEQDVLESARSFGFEVIAGPKETAIDQNRVVGLDGRAQKYVGVVAWFGVMLRLNKSE